MPSVDFLLVLLVGIGVGLVGLFVLQLLLRRRKRSADLQLTEVHIIAERVQAVSRLVGLEVSAKEIATAKKGVSWLPPLILSQARLAMIFQFEKQYAVDLSLISPEDVERLEDGGYRLRMQPNHSEW